MLVPVRWYPDTTLWARGVKTLFPLAAGLAFVTAFATAGLRVLRSGIGQRRTSERQPVEPRLSAWIVVIVAVGAGAVAAIPVRAARPEGCTSHGSHAPPLLAPYVAWKRPAGTRLAYDNFTLLAGCITPPKRHIRYDTTTIPTGRVP